MNKPEIPLSIAGTCACVCACACVCPLVSSNQCQFDLAVNVLRNCTGLVCVHGFRKRFSKHCIISISYFYYFKTFDTKYTVFSYTMSQYATVLLIGIYNEVMKCFQIILGPEVKNTFISCGRS